MKPNYILLIIAIILSHACSTRQDIIPDGFSSVKKEIPSVELDIRYYTHHNFTGRPVVGYEKPVAILTNQALFALKNVQQELNSQGMGLKVFDAYRPQMSVDRFQEWAKDINDTIAKSEFYPEVDKRDLFKLGYIAEKSGHTRGSTIDLTIINIATKSELDMGSSFDFFGAISHQDTQLITEEQKANRQLLKTTMLKHGFKEYFEEWWHFTLKDEPYPDTYFNFPVR